MSDADKTTPKQQKRVIGRPFKPGQSGNPEGRPIGARSKFAQAFVEAFARDFAEHGKEVIEKVRIEDASTYLRTACTILPRIFTLDDETLGAIKDLANSMPFDAIRYRSQAYQGESEQPKTTH